MDSGFPVIPDRAVFLADAHLGADDIHARTFLLLARKAAAERTALFLLGDIFDLWFGAPSLTFGFQAPIIEELRNLHRGGLQLYYVEGNRDFYLKKYYEGSLFDAVAEDDMRASVGPFRLFLSHGDVVNTADLAYRFWKAVSKNRYAFGAASRIPASLFLPMSERVERALKPTNPRFRGRFPETQCREFAQRRFAAGADFVILGHFHDEHVIPFAQENSPRVLAVLPAWREAWRHFYLTSDGDYGMRTFREDAPLA